AASGVLVHAARAHEALVRHRARRRLVARQRRGVARQGLPVGDDAGQPRRVPRADHAGGRADRAPMRHELARPVRGGRRARDGRRCAARARREAARAPRHVGGARPPEGRLMREVLIYLAAAVICVPLATRLGIGAILGYLAAGALVGPWGFGLVGDVAATQNLAELGVVLMLFVIGLELEPRRLAGMRGVLLRGGMLQ